MMCILEMLLGLVWGGCGDLMILVVDFVVFVVCCLDVW